MPYYYIQKSNDEDSKTDVESYQRAGEGVSPV